MSDRPIIFSGPMVRALLDGRKTQTRRILKPQPVHDAAFVTLVPDGRWVSSDVWGYGYLIDVPYSYGDRLWVREALDLGDRGCPIGHATYEADDADVDLRPDGAAVWAGGYKRRKVPSIHMPRWASRLTLTVADVRVQRLHDITEADAEAEGIERLKSGRGFYDPTASKAAVRFGEWTSTARQGFSRLWNSLHGPDAWNENPRVVALTFTVEQRNIDTGDAP
jgi:hypothetical protein